MINTKEVIEMKGLGIVESDVLWGVHMPKNKENMTDLEKEHMPVIEAPSKVIAQHTFEVRVEVGKLMVHPNEPSHFIEWLELYSGDTFVGRVLFSGGISQPVAVFKMKMPHVPGPLKAWAKCNMHGLWTSTKEIEILEMKE